LLGIERGNQRNGHGWRQLAADAGVTLDEVVRLRQVHGTRVVAATAPATVPSEADAVMTRDRRFLLTVQVADCVPVLMGDFATGAVAAVHAGWRGTAAGIGGRTVAELTRAFGSAPAHLVAAIGPSIGPCCYEVGRELRDVFLGAGWPEASISRWFRKDEPRLDLWEANRDQLIAAGVPAESISVSALCTACHPAWFHSYRRDRERAGRMVGYIRSTNSPELIPQSS